MTKSKYLRNRLFVDPDKFLPVEGAKEHLKCPECDKIVRKDKIKIHVCCVRKELLNRR